MTGAVDHDAPKVTLSLAEIDYRLRGMRRQLVRCTECGDRRGIAAWSERVTRLEGLREQALAEIAAAGEAIAARDPEHVIAKIAEDDLGIDTLEPVGSDRLDFVELGKVQIADALRAAYETGRASVKVRK